MGRTAELVENRDDTKRAVVTHSPDGEMYIVEYCSLWTPRTTDPNEGLADDSECVGTRIIAVAGPIVRRNLFSEEPPVPSAEVFALINDWQDLTDEDAEWMQAEEDAGHVDYPIGAA